MAWYCPDCGEYPDTVWLIDQEAYFDFEDALRWISTRQAADDCGGQEVAGNVREMPEAYRDYRGRLTRKPALAICGKCIPSDADWYAKCEWREEG